MKLKLKYSSESEGAMKAAFLVFVLIVAVLSAIVSRMFGQPDGFVPLPTRQLPPAVVP